MDQDTLKKFWIFEDSNFSKNPFTNRSIKPTGKKATELKAYFSNQVCKALELNPGKNPFTKGLLYLDDYYNIKQEYKCDMYNIKEFSKFKEDKTIGKSECYNWLATPTVHPITKKKVVKNSNIYKKLKGQCLPEVDNIACNILLNQSSYETHNYNPYTGRFVSKKSPAIIKLKKECITKYNKANKTKKHKKFNELCLKYIENPKINPETGQKWEKCAESVTKKIETAFGPELICPNQNKLFTKCFNKQISIISGDTYFLERNLIIGEYISGSIFSEYIALLFLMKKHKKDCTPINFNMVDLKIYGYDLFSIFSTWRYGTMEEIQIDTSKWAVEEDSRFHRKRIRKEQLVKIYWPYKFKERLQDCNYKTKRFIFINLTFDFVDTAHAGALIYDRWTKELERFEPHGNWIGVDVNYETYDKKILNKFKNSGIKVKKYITPLSYIPMESLQDIEQNNIERLNIDPGGYCAYWSLLYMDKRLSHPDKTRKEIIESLLKKINYAIEKKSNPMELIVRQYAEFYDKIQKDIFKKLVSVEVTYDNIDQLVENIIAHYLTKYVE